MIVERVRSCPFIVLPWWKQQRQCQVTSFCWTRFWLALGMGEWEWAWGVNWRSQKTVSRRTRCSLFGNMPSWCGRCGARHASTFDPQTVISCVPYTWWDHCLKWCVTPRCRREERREPTAATVPRKPRWSSVFASCWSLWGAVWPPWSRALPMWTDKEAEGPSILSAKFASQISNRCTPDKLLTFSTCNERASIHFQFAEQDFLKHLTRFETFKTKIMWSCSNQPKCNQPSH